MSKRFGLGKGLNALIPEDTVILEPKKGKDKNDDNGYSLIDINLTNLLLLILICPPIYSAPSFTMDLSRIYS